jgi:hypothetical protein
MCRECRAVMLSRKRLATNFKAKVRRLTPEAARSKPQILELTIG